VAVQEGLRRELAKRGMASDDQGFTVSPDTTFARPGPVEAVSAPTPVEPAEMAQTHFRTPDGKEWPAPQPPQFVDVSWAPPAVSRTVRAQSSQPRALPPLFATEK
jgi:hypothetical protein